MSNEALPDPQDATVLTPVIDSTGMVRISGALEIRIDKLHVKLPAFFGYIFDDEDYKAHRINFPGVDNYEPEFRTTADKTHVLIARTGEIYALDTPPTTADRRLNIYLCEIDHAAGEITTVIPRFDYVVQEGNNLGDALRFLDPVIRGCLIEANGANLHLNRYSGAILLRNAEDLTRTDVIDVSAEEKFSFCYTDRNSNIGLETDEINPNFYDNDGVIEPVPDGSYTVQRIGITYDKHYLIQYGDTVLNTLLEASDYLARADFDYPIEAGLAQGATLCYLVIRHGTVSLIADGDAKFIKTNNFGEFANSGALDSVGNLLAVNNLADVANVAQARINLGAGLAGGLATLNNQVKIPQVNLPFIRQTYGTSGTLIVHNIEYLTVLRVVFDTTTSLNATNMRIQFHSEIVDRQIEYTVDDLTNVENLAAGVILANGLQNILVPVSVSGLIAIAVRKDAVGGVDPIISGLVVSYE